jgi:hypothetical protein
MHAISMVDVLDVSNDVLPILRIRAIQLGLR